MASLGKSQLQQSRATVDRSQQAGESRSLLARVKEEFKQSTNNSLLGQSCVERDRVRANEPILVKNVQLKPRILSVFESPADGKQRGTSFANIKSEFYGKLSKQRLDSSATGTLDNLCSLLLRDRRTDALSSHSHLSRSKHLEADRPGLDSDLKSEGLRGSAR